MYRGLERFLAWLIIAVVYCFYNYPIPSIIISIVGIVGYVLYVDYSKRHVLDEGKTNRRKSALYAARVFLGSYDNIWRRLKLSNNYCTLSLVDENTIIGTEKRSDGGNIRSFSVLRSRVHPMDEVWNMFCINFSHNKSYDGLIEDCKLYKLVIEERIVEKPYCSKPEEQIQTQSIQTVDINNAGEAEITALPGISVIMAKKVIKQREEIGGFKSEKEFFDFLKLKEHQQEQLNGRISLMPLKEAPKIERFDERNVDL